MLTTTFRRTGEPENYKYTEVTTHSEEVETGVGTDAFDDELLGLESRIKNVKARKAALESFIIKDIDEGEEEYDPSAEKV